MTPRGGALVEVVLALLVLEVLIVVGHRSLAVSTAALSAGVRREHALTVAEDVRDSLSWFGYSGSGSRTGPWGRVEWVGAGTGPFQVELSVFDPAGGVAHARIATVVSGPVP